MAFNNVPLEFIMTQDEMTTKSQAWHDNIPLDSLWYVLDNKRIYYMAENNNGHHIWVRVGE